MTLKPYGLLTSTALASIEACRMDSGNLGQELAILAKHGDKWTVEELNQILFKNLVSSGPSGGHLRTFGAIQWEWELYRGRPKGQGLLLSKSF